MFNHGKLFIANNECIKVASVTQNRDDNTPEDRKAERFKAKVGQVGTIQLYDHEKAEEERVKVHGLGITKDDDDESKVKAGSDTAADGTGEKAEEEKNDDKKANSDWIHVYVEIMGESKISINQLYVSKLPGDRVDNDG